MKSRSATAFAPAVISNFFVVHDEALSRAPIDLSLVGATGGGFTLSKGVRTRVTLAPSKARAIKIKVNGDPDYPAGTTRKAVELLLDAAGVSTKVDLVQEVEVPIGQGFGSSSASALSAVMAVASALDLRLPKAEVAMFAHKADILKRTGLGTVSSTFDHTGAGVLVRPGGPGVAKVARVKVASDLRVVTASLGPLKKGNVLASRGRENAGVLGAAALETASDLKFESLLSAGYLFAEGFGLLTPTLENLISVSMKNGALGASQNMVGNAIHSVVPEAGMKALVRALKKASPGAYVDTFRIGGEPARIIRN